VLLGASFVCCCSVYFPYTWLSFFNEIFTYQKKNIHLDQVMKILIKEVNEDDTETVFHLVKKSSRLRVLACVESITHTGGSGSCCLMYECDKKKPV
jgi:hypothetical protein